VCVCVCVCACVRVCVCDCVGGQRVWCWKVTVMVFKSDSCSVSMCVLLRSARLPYSARACAESSGYGVRESISYVP
jgi:hypothetical protein